jgi:hypothetical protein
VIGETPAPSGDDGFCIDGCGRARHADLVRCLPCAKRIGWTPAPSGTPRLVHDRLNVEDAEAFTGCTSVPDATGRPRCVNPDHWKLAAAPAKEGTP